MPMLRICHRYKFDSVGYKSISFTSVSFVTWYLRIIVCFGLCSSMICVLKCVLLCVLYGEKVYCFRVSICDCVSWFFFFLSFFSFCFLFFCPVCLAYKLCVKMCISLCSRVYRCVIVWTVLNSRVCLNALVWNGLYPVHVVMV